MGAVAGLGFGIGLVLVAAGLIGPSRPRGARRTRLRPGQLGLSLVAALLAGTAALVLLAVPVAAVLAALLGACVPWWWQRRAAAKARAARCAAWPDAIDGLLGAVRAGVPLGEALCEAAHNGPEALRPGFARFASVWRRGGSPQQALLAMQRYFNDPSADRVIISLALAAEAGGSNVGRVLATQGEFLRADLRMRGEIDARQSWTVSAARVAVAAPWLAVAAVSVRPQAAEAYATPAGWVVLIGAAAVCAAAYLAMRKIASLPQPPRLPELEL